MEEKSLLRLTPAQKKKIFFLPVEQAVFVPSTKQASKLITRSAMRSRVEEVRKYLSQTFGGYTSVSGVGGYYSESKRKVIKEPVVEVMSYATKEAYKKNENDVLKHLKGWSKKWGQESMGYEFEGDLMYIPANLPMMRHKRLKEKMRRKMR